MTQGLTSLAKNQEAVCNDVSVIKNRAAIARFEDSSTNALRELINKIRQFEVLRLALVNGNAVTKPSMIEKLSELLESIKQDNSKAIEAVKKDLARAHTTGGLLQPPANLPKIQVTPALNDAAGNLSTLGATLTVIGTELEAEEKQEIQPYIEIPSLDLSGQSLPLSPQKTASPQLPSAPFVSSSSGN